MASNQRGRKNDHWYVKPRRDLDDRQVEALLLGHGNDDDRAVLTALTAMRSMRDLPVPPPSPALAAVMLNGFGSWQGAPAAPKVKAKKTPVRVAVLVAAASGALLTAATGANALPDGGQRTAASVLNVLTPFHFPTPRKPQQRPATSRPGPGSTPVQASAQPTDDRASSDPSAPNPEQTGEQGRGTGSGHGEDGHGTGPGQNGLPATGAPIGGDDNPTPEPQGSPGAGRSPEPRVTDPPEVTPTPAVDPGDEPPSPEPTASAEVTPTDDPTEPPDEHGGRQRGHGHGSR